MFSRRTSQPIDKSRTNVKAEMEIVCAGGLIGQRVKVLAVIKGRTHFEQLGYPSLSYIFSEWLNSPGYSYVIGTLSFRHNMRLRSYASTCIPASPRLEAE